MTVWHCPISEEKGQTEEKVKLNLWFKVFGGWERMFKLYTKKRLRNSEWTAFSLFVSVPQRDCLVILYRN